MTIDDTDVTAYELGKLDGTHCRDNLARMMSPPTAVHITGSSNIDPEYRRGFEETVGRPVIWPEQSREVGG